MTDEAMLARRRRILVIDSVCLEFDKYMFTCELEIQAMT